MGKHNLLNIVQLKVVELLYVYVDTVTITLVSTSEKQFPRYALVQYFRTVRIYGSLSLSCIYSLAVSKLSRNID